MERYLIISAHTIEDCRLAIDHFSKYNAGYLTHFEWGCFDNDHNAYAFIDADSPERALMAVPPLLRSKAKAIRMAQLSPREFKDEVHKQNS